MAGGRINSFYSLISFFHYKFALFSSPKATDEKLRGLHLEVEKEMLNYDISLLLMKAELSRFATSFTIAGGCELCHLSLFFFITTLH